MLLFPHLELLPVIIGQLSTCTSPDPIQMAAIVALIGGVFLFGGAGIIAVSAVATIMVQQILAGASLMAIAAAIATDMQTTGMTLTILSGIVTEIKMILGC
jgi:hypothetical protein